ncbi:hypothetical protein BHE74_00029773 [Ensete ventricosum]|nr:hypothetical protein BHE74_00029773 [Ensete ventricosum]
MRHENRHDRSSLSSALMTVKEHHIERAELVCYDRGQSSRTDGSSSSPPSSDGRLHEDGRFKSRAGCRGRRGEEEGKRAKEKEEERRKQQQISVLALLLAAIRRSMASSCRMERDADGEVIPALQHMEIGWPTDVRHVAHVTFDRFNGFLGLPVEFELEVPGRVPSARSTFFPLSLSLSLSPSVSSLSSRKRMQELFFFTGSVGPWLVRRVNYFRSPLLRWEGSFNPKNMCF